MMISELVRIAAAGGGLRVDCRQKMVSDIIRIASAAKSGNACVILENTGQLLAIDKIRIAAAGGGHVLFNDVV